MQIIPNRAKNRRQSCNIQNCKPTLNVRKQVRMVEGNKDGLLHSSAILWIVSILRKKIKIKVPWNFYILLPSTFEVMHIRQRVSRIPILRRPLLYCLPSTLFQILSNLLTLRFQPPPPLLFFCLVSLTEWVTGPH